MTKIICILLVTIFTTACASDKRADKHHVITHIQTELRGKHVDNRPDMEEICKAFSLTEQQVKDFFINAIEVKGDLAEKYAKLPCYTTGTMRINKKRYSWLIRAGGAGEFYNNEHRMLKVCGKACCDKVPGVC